MVYATNLLHLVMTNFCSFTWLSWRRPRRRASRVSWTTRRASLTRCQTSNRKLKTSSRWEEKLSNRKLRSRTRKLCRKKSTCSRKISTTPEMRSDLLQNLIRDKLTVLLKSYKFKRCSSFAALKTHCSGRSLDLKFIGRLTWLKSHEFKSRYLFIAKIKIMLVE